MMKDHLTEKHSGNYKSEITLTDIKALRVKETKRIKALQAKERGIRPEVQVLQDSSSANTQKNLSGKVVSDFKSLKNYFTSLSIFCQTAYHYFSFLKLSKEVKLARAKC